MDATLQRALEIAGWPEWDEDGDRYRVVQSPGGSWVNERRSTVDHSDWEAQRFYTFQGPSVAILEKHLREWLEARGWHLRPIIGSSGELIGYAVVRNSEEWMAVDGPYLAALAAAVVECGGKEGA